MSDKIRKEFEAWAKTYKPKSLANSSGDAWQKLEKGNSNNYKHAGVHYAWLGFQAAYKASRHEELFIMLHKLAYPSGVETIEKAERLQAQELLKLMER